MADVHSVISENIDVWTGAVKKRNATGRGTSKKNELVGLNKLREFIFELAIRGKLVPQNPNDEPASEMLERRKAEKAKLAKEGKIKKQRNSPEINEEEIFFNSPNGWAWSRMGCLAQYQKGYAFKSKDYLESGLMIAKIQNLTDAHIQNSVYIDPERALEFSQYLLCEGDIVMTTVGSWFSAPKSAVGRAFLINKLFDNSLLNQNAVRIRTCKELDSMYLLACINSPVFKKYLVQEAQGTANQASITQASIKNFLICVPPKEEQHRIVAKVDELMALCDQLEQQTEDSITAHKTLVETLLGALTNSANANDFQQSWKRIAQHFDILFTTEDSIDQLKQTILQLAVMGKLVPQDPNDEPASVLLEKIAKEKERLVAEGKIKKPKKLPEVTSEEEPFEVPKGWTFERLENMTKLITKGSSPKWQGVSYTDNPEDVLFVTSENVGSFKLLFKNRKYVEKQFNEVEPRSILRKNDFLMNIVGASIGRTAIYDIDELANINQAVCLIRSFSEYICGEFFLNFFNSEICISYMYDKQVDNARPNLSMSNISKFVIPVPPIEEQERIVSRVDELFALCDQLKSQLSDAQNTQLHLADAIVERAVG